MGSRLLTQAESDRFCEWLRFELEGSRAILKQMEKSDLPPAMTAHEKQWATVCLMMLRKLESTERMTIGESEQGETDGE